MQDLNIVGIDEVGRGPIAGPLLVCAVLLPQGYDMRKLLGVNDSKQLSKEEREDWYAFAQYEKEQSGLEWGFGWITSQEIDTKGMSAALRLAVEKSLGELGRHVMEAKIYLDGSLYAPAEYVQQETIVGGDAKVPAISLASVIAKVTRDREMTEFGEKYPSYGFERHMGYGTRAHFEAIRAYGMTDIHRRSFLRNI
jgi:ribonuclease HII